MFISIDIIFSRWIYTYLIEMIFLLFSNECLNLLFVHDLFFIFFLNGFWPSEFINSRFITFFFEFSKIFLYDLIPFFFWNVQLGSRIFIYQILWFLSLIHCLSVKSIRASCWPLWSATLGTGIWIQMTTSWIQFEARIFRS